MCKSNYNAFRGVVFRMQNYEKPLIRAAARQIFSPHLLLKTAPPAAGSGQKYYPFNGQ